MIYEPGKRSYRCATFLKKERRKYEKKSVKLYLVFSDWLSFEIEQLWLFLHDFLLNFCLYNAANSSRLGLMPEDCK